MKERIYLDSCVLSRPTDDQAQERIRAESSAIAQILDAVAERKIEWIASSALRLEVGRNPNPQRRADTLELLALATTTVAISPAAILRSRLLNAEGYGFMDAIHLAIAEEAAVDVLLTVDDRFLHRAATRLSNSHPLVENPVNWLRRRQPWLIKR